ncbi:unnamed protein product [Prorocentrum cordatum]|uniref:HECT domain-containing protein n=1 Tax=Prorocentrum cordatum TaxID=2364126 RepID=A0ABN9QSL4_9DINO|nr:unnamed protein product [Polarella glacialis]
MERLSSDELRLCVDRADVYGSALAQVARLPPEELARPLQVGFAGEAAEDAGGPRREFFNEFGRAAASAAGAWSSTPAGTLRPSLSPAGDAAAAFRGRPGATNRSGVASVS